MIARADRLAGLRAVLRAAGLDGFVLERGDMFQGEEVRAGDERLAWLTGFDGSAGLAVILPDKAAVFSDSRYSLQLQRQLDPGQWQGFDTGLNGMADWLAAQAGTGQLRMGYAAQTTSWARLQGWQKTCSASVADWQGLNPHPIDALWHDRPEFPARHVWQLPDDMSGQSAAEKLAALQAGLVAEGLAAQLVTDPMAVNWLFNLRGDDLAHSPVHLCFAMIPAQGRPQLIAASAKAAQLAGAGHLELADIHDCLARLAGQGLAADEASCPVFLAEAARASGARLVWQPDRLIDRKACKNQAELDGFRAAHLADARAFIDFWFWLDQQSGLADFSESDLAARLQSNRAEQAGYLHDSFPAIVGFADNGAVVHYRARPGQDRKIDGPGLLLIDSGGHYQQGSTDITRTLAIGAVDPAARQAASSVLAAHAALAGAVFPAHATGAQLDAMVRSVLWARQLDYGHGTGHGVGHLLSVHEGPVSLSPRCHQRLQPGMVLSIEPGYYETGQFGVRQENLVTVRQRGPGWLEFEPLAFVPFDRQLADPACFTDDQLAWLNGYHKQVFDRLSGSLPAEKQAWLAEKCAAIER